MIHGRVGEEIYIIQGRVGGDTEEERVGGDTGERRRLKGIYRGGLKVIQGRGW